MRMVDIIRKKRDGLDLSREEIRFFIKGYTYGQIPDYQAAALMMAIYFKDLNQRETLDITQAVIDSGQTLDLSVLPGIKVDKHSTGGVGDKTTIVLLPLVAAAGAIVAKLTGKGLAHTGGTMDKLKAFEGIRLEPGPDQFIQQLKEIGLAIQGQTADIVPADKKLYALRDVTATVQNTAMIACSIMSKKIACGADAIVLDVKVGHGAFMSDPEAARQLAEQMVGIGHQMGRKTIAILSNMDQPLGRAVGNIIEVREAIEVLRGRGPDDLRELCMELGAHMLVLAQISRDIYTAKELLAETIASGAAIRKLKAMVKAQGGDALRIDDYSLFDEPPHTMQLISPQSGYVTGLHARTVGEAAMMLGAGRKTKDSPIDLTAGIYLHAKIGDYLTAGEPLADVFCSEASLLKPAANHLMTAYSWSDTCPDRPSVIIGKVETK